MYGALWRRLPGRWPAKSLASLTLLAGVVALLFLVVFPYIEPRLPYNRVTVDTTSTAAPSPTTPAPTSRPGVPQ